MGFFFFSFLETCVLCIITSSTNKFHTLEKIYYSLMHYSWIKCILPKPFIYGTKHFHPTVLSSVSLAPEMGDLVATVQHQQICFPSIHQQAQAGSQQETDLIPIGHDSQIIHWWGVCMLTAAHSSSVYESEGPGKHWSQYTWGHTAGGESSKEVNVSAWKEVLKVKLRESCPAYCCV